MAKAATIHLVAAFSLAATALAAPLFERVPAEVCGVDFRNRFDEDGERSFLYHSGFACGSIAIGDVDGDHKPDLFFSGGAGENGLYLNRGGMKFVKSAAGKVIGGGENWGSGSSLADVDQDGDLDLYVCNYNTPNQLFLNDGAGKFTEAGAGSGLAVSGPSQQPLFADFDRDGDLDLFLLNTKLYLPDGRPKRPPYEMVDGRPVIAEAYRPYLTLKPKPDGTFSIDDFGHDRRFEPSAGKWGIDHEGMSFAAATGDLDGDGDPDLVVANLDEAVHLYRNQATGGGRFSVRLVGGRSNRMGIGAKVSLTDSAGVKRSRWMTPQGGFLSQDDTRLLFGLAGAKPVAVEVDWPSGIRQIVQVGNSETALVIAEQGEVTPRPAARPPMFSAVEAPGFTHREKDFDDYARQPLLPGKLSQLGPCLAVGDVDGDVDDDLFAGGATGQAAALFLGDGAGRFIPSPQQVFDGFGKFTESADATWFDADGDGDLDLYVVSGSVEFDAGNIFYRDRLYVNEGGKLSEAPQGSLPDLRDSGSCAAAADFDSDGDLDLFVGSRSMVGQYPLSPDSRLLRNDGGLKFTDVTDELAPGLRRCGLVTDAVWADIDADKDADLCLSTEWGPVRIFSNAEGKLSQSTAGRALAGRLGWWTCVEAIDIDGDGDLDLLAGNVGRNTKYGKSAELYYGDMDASGTPHIIEAKLVGTDLLPVRGRSCSSQAMPILGAK